MFVVSNRRLWPWRSRWGSQFSFDPDRRGLEEGGHLARDIRDIAGEPIDFHDDNHLNPDAAGNVFPHHRADHIGGSSKDIVEVCP